MKKKKILFVNDEMTMGGVARILNTLLSMIDREKYDVDLLVLHKRGELLKEVPEGMSVYGGSSFFDTVDIPLSQCRGKNLLSKLRLLFYMKSGLIEQRIKKERKQFLKKHYDIEFSAKEGFCTIFVASGDSDRKINWVQVDYKECNYSKNHMALMKKMLKKIDMNIACSEKVKDSYVELFNVGDIKVIHNLINEKYIKALSKQKVQFIKPSNKINLITVARFHPQKGLDRLIRAYAKVKDYYKLTIVGDGELKDDLYTLAKDLGVFDDIVWTGILANPYPEIKAADLFVLPSVYEGYPTITIESLVCGTPVLALEVAGIKEQITNRNMGYIIANKEERLVFKLEELKDQKEVLLKAKEALKDYHYDNQKILEAYYAIFNGEE